MPERQYQLSQQLSQLCLAPASFSRPRRTNTLVISEVMHLQPSDRNQAQLSRYRTSKFFSTASCLSRKTIWQLLKLTSGAATTIHTCGWSSSGHRVLANGCSNAGSVVSEKKSNLEVVLTQRPQARLWCLQGTARSYILRSNRKRE